MSKEQSIATPGTDLSNADLEHLKFRFRIREVLLDKLVLAVLLVAVAMYGNWRLEQYEHAMDAQLEQLRQTYNFERVVAEREVRAHEDAWNALVAFRKLTNSYLGEKMTPESDEKIEAATMELSQLLDVQQMYLDPAVQREVEALYKKTIPAFIERWTDDPGTKFDACCQTKASSRVLTSIGIFRRPSKSLLTSPWLLPVWLASATVN